MDERLIFHVDVNSAFLSWEAVSSLHNGGTLDLRTVPSCVGGDPKKRSSIVAAKSIPAKKYGITTGEPVSMAIRKCPEIIVVPPHFSLYKKMSRAFKDILREYTPVMESFSIDEAFMDMSGMGLLYPDPVALAHEIKDRIKRELEFTVNVGIARNKLCAKMASDFEKPDKVHTLYPEEIAEKMWPLSVGDLFGCGKKTAEKLCQIKICTIGELARADEEVLREHFGEKAAEYLHRAANGEDESPVQSEVEDAKSYGAETTVEEDLTDLESINRILRMQADVVGARLRANGVRSFCITVSYRTNDFKKKSHGKKREEATDVTEEIYAEAVRLMKEFWKGEPVRLVGLSASEIDQEGFEQLSLFEDPGREKQKKLDRALDEIRGKFGNDSVVRAGIGKFR